MRYDPGPAWQLPLEDLCRKHVAAKAAAGDYTDAHRQHPALMGMERDVCMLQEMQAMTWMQMEAVKIKEGSPQAAWFTACHERHRQHTFMPLTQIAKCIFEYKP